MQLFRAYEKNRHFIEIELGVTGGEEDGVDNTDIDSSKLYTQPEEVAYAYEKLKNVKITSQLQHLLEMYTVFINQEM